MCRKSVQQELLHKHPSSPYHLRGQDSAATQGDDEIEAVARAAAGRLVLLYWPTYIAWLNPIELLWRHFRREVTITSCLRT